MVVAGQYDTEGKLTPFKDPVEVNQLGNRLLCKDGICWALRDSYGDWVSPTLHSVGVKCKVKVSEK
jgi:hypothetical protein